jgi:hypothetical protein
VSTIEPVSVEPSGSAPYSAAKTRIVHAALELCPQIESGLYSFEGIRWPVIVGMILDPEVQKGNALRVKGGVIRL